MHVAIFDLIESLQLKKYCLTNNYLSFDYGNYTRRISYTKIHIKITIMTLITRKNKNSFEVLFTCKNPLTIRFEFYFESKDIHKS